MTSTQHFYDPRGAVEADALAAAVRASAIKGKRLAILDNTKWNAGKLLRGIQDQLAADAGLSAINYYRKHSFSMNAAPELIEEIAANNDLVITAIGD
ncbi:MAG: hypothetical protein ABL891_18370 [Burkholderiales bacterium]